jgi:hypothetical protein
LTPEAEPAPLGTITPCHSKRAADENCSGQGPDLVIQIHGWPGWELRNGRGSIVATGGPQIHGRSLHRLRTWQNTQRQLVPDSP